MSHTMSSSMQKNTPFLRANDLISIIFEQNWILNADGFASPDVCMQRNDNTQHIKTLFFIRKGKSSGQNQQGEDQDDIDFNEPIVFQHMLSNKCLSYTSDFGNKWQIQLRSTPCEFVIKAIYKCQVGRYKKVRNNEQVIITPYQNKSRSEKMAVTVNKFQSHLSKHFTLSVAKNEHSSFLLRRRTSRDLSDGAKITNIPIYQLRNIETDKYLCYDQQKESVNNMKKQKLRFDDPSNQDCTLITLVPKGKDNISFQQHCFAYNEQLFIYFYSAKAYLCYDIMGHAELTQIPSNDCSFIVQQYNDQLWQQSSAVKFKHKNTNKYLSFNANNCLMLSEFKLISTFVVEQMDAVTLRSVLFVNEFHHALERELSSGVFSFNNKKYIRKVLRQMRKLIYQNRQIETEFLSMSRIKIMLNTSEQDLFAAVGLIEQLCTAGRRILEQLLAEKSQDLAQEYEIMLNIMIVLVGICKKNDTNIRILWNSLTLLTNCVGIVPGAIECLYYLLENDKLALMIMAESEHSYKRTKLKSLELLVQIISSRTLQLPTRCKTMKLFQCFVLVDGKDKIVMHETILLNAIRSKKLRDTFLTVRHNDNHQLVIFIDNWSQQLQEMVNRGQRYRGELQLLVAQLHFMCSLCCGSNLKNIAYFRQLVSEDVIYHYLSSQLNPQFKEVFMRILIDIYLDVQDTSSVSGCIVVTHIRTQPRSSRKGTVFEDNSILSTKLMNDVPARELQMEQVDRKAKFFTDLQALSRIRIVVLEMADKALRNSQIDKQFSINLKALRKFMEMNMVPVLEMQKMKRTFAEFIASERSLASSEPNIQNIIVEILSIFLYDETQNIIEFSNKFVHSLLKLFPMNFQSKRQAFSPRTVEEFYTEFVQSNTFFTGESGQLRFLDILISSNLKRQNTVVFYETARLAKLIAKRQCRLIQSLKEKLIIDSEWSYQMYRHVNKLKTSLIAHIEGYLYCDNDTVLQSQRTKLTNILLQINSLFHEYPTGKQDQSSPISTFSQALFRQCNFLIPIVQFIDARQRDIQLEANTQLFHQCFSFVSMFLSNNDNNIFYAYHKISKIKSVYRYPDKGQVSILLTLARTALGLSLVFEFLFDSMICAIESNHEPRPEILIGIIKLLHKNPKQTNRFSIQKLAKLLIKKNQFLASIMKITNRQFSWSDDTTASRYNKDWTNYLTLAVHLLMILINHSKERLPLEYVRTTLPLKTLIDTIEYYFTVSCSRDGDLRDKQNLTWGQQTAELRQLSYSLCKQQLIVLFQKVYLEELASLKQFQYILSFVQRLTNRMPLQVGVPITALFTTQAPSTTLRELLLQIVHIKTKKSHLTIESVALCKLFNDVFLIITIYYPSLAKTLHSILTSHQCNNESLRKQVNLTLQILSKKINQFIKNQLTYSLYVAHNREYLQAIHFLQENTMRKIQFNMKYLGEQEGQSDELIYDQDGGYFINPKIKNTIDNFTFTESGSQKSLYQAFIVLFYSQRIAKSLQSVPHTIYPQMNLIAIHDLFLQLIKDQTNRLKNSLQVLLYYVRKYPKERQSELSLVFEQQSLIIGYLSMRNIDSDNQMLNIYLQLDTLLMTAQFECSETNDSHKRTILGENTKILNNDFMKRLIKFIVRQGQLYEQKQFRNQTDEYCKSIPLSYENGLCSTLTIETILIWLKYKLACQNYKAINLQSLILQVADLLKAYVDFVATFQTRYLPAQLHNKILLCLQILFFAVSFGDDKIIHSLIQKHIWHQFNILLRMDDGWQLNLEQLQLSHMQLLKTLTMYHFDNDASNYIKNVFEYYNNSLNVYGQDRSIMQDQYPLIPRKALYGQLKKQVIMLLKEFRIMSKDVTGQLLQYISIPDIDKNIIQTYLKHKRLFAEYTPSSLSTDILYADHQYQQIAQNMMLENSIELTALKMYIESLHGDFTLEEMYTRKRMEIVHSKKIQNAMSTFWEFILDIILLFFSLCIDFAERRKNRQQVKVSEQQALQFMLDKIGRVEIYYGDKLVTWEFVVHPECSSSQPMRQDFQKHMNFSSVQLKRQYIRQSADYFILHYENQRKFYDRFHSIRLMYFLTKNSRILKLISYLLIIANNIFLLSNGTLQSQYFITFNPSDPFGIIAIANIIIQSLVLMNFIAKDVPLVIATVKHELQQGKGYFGTKYLASSVRQQQIIVVLMSITNQQVIYYVVSTLLAYLMLLNKIFVAVLLLDVLAHIPTLRTLLMSLWKPKLQIVLAVGAFTIVQYFFSIFLFFNFRTETQGYCNQLGQCFTFLFVTTYKTVSGFVGFLFNLTSSLTPSINLSISSFELFEDFYVIFVYQIFFSLLLAIIIDSFSIAQSDKVKINKYLSSVCIVCNLDRNTFNISSQTTFKMHIAVNHHIFSYFSLQYFIMKKQAKHRNGFQTKILNKNIQWLPNNAQQITYS